MKSNRVKKIDSNIEESFQVIDDYLPKIYVAKVLEKVPDTTPEVIRQVRKRRSGDIRIIAALKKVAEESRSLLTN